MIRETDVAITPDMKLSAEQILEARNDLADMSLKRASALISERFACMFAEKPRFTLVRFDDEVRSGTIVLDYGDEHPLLHSVRLERTQNRWASVHYRHHTITSGFVGV